MAYPYYNPYQSNYFPTSIPTPQPAASIIWVSGDKEAAAYPVAPNNAVTLWDSDAPVIYLKQADASGKPVMKTFDLVERTAAKPAGDYDSVMKSITEMRTEIESLKKEVFKDE